MRATSKHMTLDTSDCHLPPLNLKLKAAQELIREAEMPLQALFWNSGAICVYHMSLPVWSAAVKDMLVMVINRRKGEQDYLIGAQESQTQLLKLQPKCTGGGCSV